jgi:hypothetical protein
MSVSCDTLASNHTKPKRGWPNVHTVLTDSSEFEFSPNTAAPLAEARWQTFFLFSISVQIWTRMMTTSAAELQRSQLS